MKHPVTTSKNRVSPLRSDWISHRLDLYRRVRAHVRSLLGAESVGLSRYREQYEKDCNRKGWETSDRQELLRSVEFARLVWLADFHALEQSQKAQLRILKALKKKQPRILGLECILAEHQKTLDQFVAGHISESKFLEEVQWSKNWGFPWEHYRPLLDWARSRQVKCLALNLKTKERTSVTLSRRDRFAADLCARALTENPTHQLIVVFGEWHLARAHLPAETRKLCPGLAADQMLTIWQNSEKIYFQLLREHQDDKVDVVRWPSGQFCVLSVPPWVQLQSYLLYLESQVDQALDPDDDEAEAPDWTDPVAEFYRVICADLQLDSNCEDLAVYTAADDMLFEKINSMGTRDNQKWYLNLIRASRSFHAPEWGISFLAKPTVNEAASLAMKVLHAKLSNQKRTWNRFPDDFRRQIFAEALHYLGSKMINPKRKTDTVQDLRASLVTLASGRPQGSQGRREVAREALQLALSQKMQEHWREGRRGKPGKSMTSAVPHSRLSYFEAARILGGMMGERLFAGYREGVISNLTLKKWLSQSLESEVFDSFYVEILEVVESLPEPFLSKVERL